MNVLRGTRNALFAVTIAGWLWFCWAFWQALIRSATDSPEIYTRGPGFQLLNFVVQYLWFFVLALAVALVVEWALVWIIGRVLVRSRVPGV
jgi:hypothetical protein